MQRAVRVGSLLAVIAGCSGPPAAPVAYVHVKLAPGEHDIEGAAPLFQRGVGAIAVERAVLLARGIDVPDLGAWRRIAVPAGEAEARRIVAELAGDPRVDTAFVAPEPELAAIAVLPGPAAEKSCPVTTPTYDRRQRYLGPAPEGIDAALAWTVPGGRGRGVWFADVEGGWNAGHEDLPNRLHHAGGRPIQDRGWHAHGTAVVGEVAATDNGLGMIGITPDVDRIVTASIGDIGAAAAIDAAQSRLRPGDVLLIELHAIGPRGRFLPVEYWDDVYESVTVATARGVIVVAAAGNGGEHLGHPEYGGKLDPSVRDSGAILVGAGAPPRLVDRSRLSFSNYGARVDVQGWGRDVATLDYGDLQDCDLLDRRYTAAFSGTSSASPIVAGAAIAIQGAVLAAGRPPLSPRAMRDLLRRTGSPQRLGPHGPSSQRIGPRPDLARALRELDLLGQQAASPCKLGSAGTTQRSSPTCMPRR